MTWETSVLQATDPPLEEPAAPATAASHSSLYLCAWGETGPSPPLFLSEHRLDPAPFQLA